MLDATVEWDVYEVILTLSSLKGRNSTAGWSIIRGSIILADCAILLVPVLKKFTDADSD